MNLSKKEIVDILKSPDTDIFKEANEVRKKYVGDGVHLRGLIFVNAIVFIVDYNLQINMSNVTDYLKMIF